MRAYLLLLPLALAACSADRNNPRYAECFRQVNADPEVRDLTMKYAGSATTYQQNRFDPEPLRRDKMKACLHGYPADSGVEPIKHQNVTFDLF